MHRDDINIVRTLNINKQQMSDGEDVITKILCKFINRGKINLPIFIYTHSFDYIDGFLEKDKKNCWLTVI